MNVKELIELLEEYGDHLEVVFEAVDGYKYQIGGMNFDSERVVIEEKD